eukprot:s887_g20.t1
MVLPVDVLANVASFVANEPAATTATLHAGRGGDVVVDWGPALSLAVPGEVRHRSRTDPPPSVGGVPCPPEPAADAAAAAGRTPPEQDQRLVPLPVPGRACQGGAVPPPHQGKFFPRGAPAAFLRTLGSPKDSVLVILDDAHRNEMPVLPKNEGRAPRRAVCVLGCPAGLTSQQEAVLASAARSAGWQVRKLGLGHAAEFTSKILARLQVCHSAGHFLPALRQLGCTETPWPTQQHATAKCFGKGASLHFLLPVPLDLASLSRQHQSVAERRRLAHMARASVAAICHSKGGWKGCYITLRFKCGTAVTLSGPLPEQFIRAKVAMSEFKLLQTVKQALRTIGNGQGTEKPMDGIKVHAAGDQALPYLRPCQVQVLDAQASSKLPVPADTQPLSVALRQSLASQCDALVVHLAPLPPAKSEVPTASMVLLSHGATTVVEVISIFQSGFMGAPATSGALLLDKIFEVRMLNAESCRNRGLRDPSVGRGRVTSAHHGGR